MWWKWRAPNRTEAGHFVGGATRDGIPLRQPRERLAVDGRRSAGRGPAPPRRTASSKSRIEGAVEQRAGRRTG